jgi:hypothetical protein
MLAHHLPGLGLNGEDGGVGRVVDEDHRVVEAAGRRGDEPPFRRGEVAGAEAVQIHLRFRTKEPLQYLLF